MQAHAAPAIEDGRVAPGPYGQRGSFCPPGPPRSASRRMGRDPRDAFAFTKWVVAWGLVRMSSILLTENQNLCYSQTWRGFWRRSLSSAIGRRRNLEKRNRPCDACNPLKCLKTAKEILGKIWRNESRIWKGLEQKLGGLARLPTRAGPGARLKPGVGSPPERRPRPTAPRSRSSPAGHSERSCRRGTGCARRSRSSDAAHLAPGSPRNPRAAAE
jgi:hypothetical protein